MSTPASPPLAARPRARVGVAVRRLAGLPHAIGDTPPLLG